MLPVSTPPNDILAEILENNNTTLRLSELLTSKFLENQKEVFSESVS